MTMRVASAVALSRCASVAICVASAIAASTVGWWA